MNPNVIRIDKHVPVPPLRGQGGSKYEFLTELDVGDSFVIDSHNPDFTPKETISSVYSFAHILRQRGGQFRNFRVATRTLKGSFRRPKAVRIWRVK